MLTRFVPNPTFAAKLLRSPQMEGPMLEIAQRVQAEAVRIAPTRLDVYRRSLRALSGRRGDGVVVGRVLSDDFKAMWIEFGTSMPGPTEEFAPLRRALERVTGRGIG